MSDFEKTGNKEPFKWDMSSDDEEYISPANLCNYLGKLIENINNNKYTDVTRQDIFDSVEEYMTGESKNVDPDTLSYLFRGWWVSDSLRRAARENSERKILNPPNCPYCLRSMPANNP